MPKVGDFYPDTYFTGTAMEGEDEQVLTIDAVVLTKLQNPNTGETEQKPVVFFKEDDRGLVLGSKSKFNTMAEVLDLEDSDDWPGQKVRIFPTRAQFQGKPVPSVGFAAA